MLTLKIKYEDCITASSEQIWVKKNYFKEGQKHLGWAFRLSSPRAATLLLFSFPQQSTCEKTECKAILAVQNMCSQFLFCVSSCFTTPPPWSSAVCILLHMLPSHFVIPLCYWVCLLPITLCWLSQQPILFILLVLNVRTFYFVFFNHWWTVLGLILICQTTRELHKSCLTSDVCTLVQKSLFLFSGTTELSFLFQPLLIPVINISQPLVRTNLNQSDKLHE